jgi:dihydrolipoamide dehydrogenase
LRLPTASASGPIATPWCRPKCRSKLLVIGSGAIGIEFASFYNDMGAEVTVVEVMDRVVPVEDADVSAFLEKALKKQGMTIMTGAGVRKLKRPATGVSAKIKGKDGKIAKANSAIASSPSASSPMSEKYRAGGAGHQQVDQGAYQDRRMCRTNVRASGPSATSPRRPGWRTRRAMRA